MEACKFKIKIRPTRNGVSSATDVEEVSIDGVNILHSVQRVAVIFEPREIVKVELTMLASNIEIDECQPYISIIQEVANGKVHETAGLVQSTTGIFSEAATEQVTGA
jgi:hypothetical protein